MKSRGLDGRVVFLSASVPDIRREAEYRADPEPGVVYDRVEDAHVEVERAVVSLARAVLSAGGRLAFGAHPSISPLVAMVAGEYRLPAAAERGPDEPPAVRSRAGSGEEAPLVLIYQSRAFQEVVPDETWLLHRLGYAQIRWTAALRGERYRPEMDGQAQCRKSLALMRQAMLRETDPVAMVALGGMSGVLEEAAMFRELFPTRRVYVMENTGGAAARLARHGGDAVTVLDRRVLEQLHEIDPTLQRSGRDRSGRDEPGVDQTDKVPYRYTPYPLIMQLVVEDLFRAGETEAGSV
ncbi:MAG TPA: hypothetical protein VGB92_00320 [Longimicrobium sp.]